MTDQNTANEMRAEGLREDFYQAITDGDWPVARQALSLMEDMRISTYEFRREMNKAMAETDDITYEPYEAVIPVMSEYEKRTGQMPYTGGDSRGSREAEEQNLSMIARQFNA